MCVKKKENAKESFVTIFNTSLVDIPSNNLYSSIYLLIQFGTINFLANLSNRNNFISIRSYMYPALRAKIISYKKSHNMSRDDTLSRKLYQSLIYENFFNRGEIESKPTVSSSCDK